MNNLPYEIKEYIMYYIPKQKCSYCFRTVISYKQYNNYCSNTCCLKYNILILSRINRILFFYFTINLKLLFIFIINISIISINLIVPYVIFKWLQHLYYCGNILDNECCIIY